MIWNVAEQYKASELSIKEYLKEVKELEHCDLYDEFDGETSALFVIIDRVRLSNGRKATIQLIDADGAIFDLLNFTTRDCNLVSGASTVYFKLDHVKTENKRVLEIIETVRSTLLKFYTEECARPSDAVDAKRSSKRMKVSEEEGEEEEEDALENCIVLGKWGWMTGAYN